MWGKCFARAVPEGAAPLAIRKLVQPPLFVLPHCHLPCCSAQRPFSDLSPQGLWESACPRNAPSIAQDGRMKGTMSKPALAPGDLLGRVLAPLKAIPALGKLETGRRGPAKGSAERLAGLYWVGSIHIWVAKGQWWQPAIGPAPVADQSGPVPDWLSPSGARSPHLSAGTMETRKPALRPRPLGSLLLRVADRQRSAGLLQLPPRAARRRASWRSRRIVRRRLRIIVFAYGKASWVEDAGRPAIEVEIKARKNGRAICSGCGRTGPGYDRLSKRRFEFVPLWGMAVFLVYATRWVDCPV